MFSNGMLHLSSRILIYTFSNVTIQNLHLGRIPSRVPELQYDSPQKEAGGGRERKKQMSLAWFSHFISPRF